jgi:glycosyltransferase involved in cell wall biosynthesis
LRILFFSRDYTPHDQRFLAFLGKTGHEAFFLRLELRERKGKNLALPAGIEPVSWYGGRREARWQDVPGYLRDLKRVIEYIRPDLIHAGPIQNCALLTALEGFRPLVSMSWGYDLLFDAGRNRLWNWATRYALRRTSVLLGDCEVVRGAAIRLGMRSDRTVIFPWGVDLDHFKPGEPDLKDDRWFTLLSVRGWEPIYGVDTLAQGFVLAARECSNLRLVMLGSGSLAETIQSIFTRGGVAERVITPGWTEPADLLRYYQSADLYLSCSHVDGSSVSLMEALACGCPVLVSDIPGNREWVTQGIQGWLFPDGDGRALAEGILTAVKNKRQLAEMGQAARRTAEQRADWRKNSTELLRAYQLALDSD